MASRRRSAPWPAACEVGALPSVSPTPRPGIAARRVEKSRLLAQIQRIRQRLVADGLVPMHAVGDVIEIWRIAVFASTVRIRPY
jgi:hypothetical protein